MKKLVIVLSVLVLLSSGCKFFGKKKQAEKDRIEKAKQDSIKKVKEAADLAKINKEKEEKARQEAIQKAEEERQRLYKFHIIVGSFKTPKYAAAYKDYIGKKGYQTEILVNSYKFEMISIGAYKSWGEAVKDLYKAREVVEATSWIYIKGQ
ncbi:MAG: hypothetical protein A2041_14555 [Bacteroidetes bacterium GWA2_31_9b]|nr:MAG: hypothetical protein A2041_14555 [Bacteroidetes bacterium GWA2_31_9b]